MLSIESRPDSYGTSKSEQKKEEDEMNKVILIGRLTKAPEIKCLKSIWKNIQRSEGGNVDGRKSRTSEGLKA